MKLAEFRLPASPLTQLQPGHQLLLATAIIALGSLAIAHGGILQPMERREIALRQQLAAAQEQADLLKAYATHHATLVQLQAQLPSTSHMATLLQELTALATTHRLTVNTVTPQQTRPIGRYRWGAIQVDATGTFADALQFLQTLETSGTRFRVSQLELLSNREPADRPYGFAGSDQSLPTTGPPTLQLRMQLSVLLTGT